MKETYQISQLRTSENALRAGGEIARWRLRVVCGLIFCLVVWEFLVKMQFYGSQVLLLTSYSTDLLSL